MTVKSSYRSVGCVRVKVLENSFPDESFAVISQLFGTSLTASNICYAGYPLSSSPVIPSPTEKLPRDDSIVNGLAS